MPEGLIQMRISTVLLIVGWALLFNSITRADSLRCGTNLIGVGDTKAEVLEKCGEPESTDSYCRNEYFQSRFGIDAICHRVDLWTFNLGVGRFLENIEFEEGRVSRITNGDRAQ
jgi:hypothetical protein